jgi:hypothetical protein
MKWKHWLCNWAGKKRTVANFSEVTSFTVKLEVLRNTKNLFSWEIRVDEDFSLKTRNTRSWIPFLKDTDKDGLGAFLKGKAAGKMDLDYVVKNIQLGVEGNGLDVSVRNSV